MAETKTAGGFVATTYRMLNVGYEEAGWSDDGKAVVVRNPEKFAVKILPEHFKHSQFASWVRGANAHGFKKTGRGEWMHPSFQRDRPDLLPLVQRKKPRPTSAPPKANDAAGKTADDAADESSSWPLATLKYELGLILEQESDALDFLREEVRRLEEEKAQLAREQVADAALHEKLSSVVQFLQSETRALKPPDGLTATEFGAKYNCPLKLPGLRMLGTNPMEDDEFACTHRLVANHPGAIELANTPEYAAKICELREQYEEFCTGYPEYELSVHELAAGLGLAVEEGAGC